MCISTALSGTKNRICDIDFSIDFYHGEVVILIKPVGKITKKALLLAKAFLEDAITESPEKSVRLIIDATIFNGWEYDAFLEDIKLGLQHRKDIDKIAFCGHQRWQEVIVELANYIMNAEVQYFEHLAEAELWATL
ncbi:STAS/SEC14 domain-containing protein [Vibrio breoganii]